jgi:hypothetical protein
MKYFGRRRVFLKIQKNMSGRYWCGRIIESKVIHIIFSMMEKSVINYTIHEIYGRQHVHIGVHHDGDTINKNCII